MNIPNPLLDEVIGVFNIINHPCGYDIGWGGVLTIRRYEAPKWAVEWDVWVSDTERKLEVKELDNPMDAASFFVMKRHELKLGLDYETENITKV